MACFAVETMNWPRFCIQIGVQAHATSNAIGDFKETVMIVRRRTWFYRLAGQKFAQVITFTMPVTAAKVRDALSRSVGAPLELWGRSAH